jgi:hypothetical protein
MSHTALLLHTMLSKYGTMVCYTHGQTTEFFMKLGPKEKIHMK